MKPITHPLAIMAINEYVNTCSGTVEGRAAEGWRDRMFLFRQWSEAGCPRYADPTPLPAPALGMRVWCEAPAEGPGVCQHHYDVEYVRDGMTWLHLLNTGDEIALITDYRKGDIVLWERQ